MLLMRHPNFIGEETEAKGSAAESRGPCRNADSEFRSGVSLTFRVSNELPVGTDAAHLRTTP